MPKDYPMLSMLILLALLMAIVYACDYRARTL